MFAGLKHAMPYVAGLIIAILVLSYAADYAILRYRVATQKNPFGQVTVSVYFATPMKDGKTEYDFQQPQAVTCVNALYPHLGMQPCWYLSRHREQRIETM